MVEFNCKNVAISIIFYLKKAYITLVLYMYIVGGRTLARRRPYKNDTRKLSNRTRRRTHI